GDIASLKNVIGEQTAGIVIEPIQGEGGIQVAQPDYLAAVRQLCDDQDLVLMFDEVQCGVARTGTLYAYQQLGATPDVLASAKGLGGGFPVGACLASETLAAPMIAGTHGSTFGGNPLAMAVANAVIDELSEPGFLQRLTENGEYFTGRLRQLVDAHPTLLQQVTGLGLMIGLQCHIDMAELVARLQQAGLLVVKSGGNSIRIMPPLNVAQSELDEALAIFSKVLTDW
ncbi:MAG: aminotransferase class III-fold pyridoxal phosphate-dependent enzyme, partial [Proteobacteria bacterium]|nr:aminotransferase class III-fold pyridoxal phosphate-dependent enzyme [Pseudomonadota bacterium]